MGQICPQHWNNRERAKKEVKVKNHLKKGGKLDKN
jgi:hypothetical protein